MHKTCLIQLQINQHRILNSCHGNRGAITITNISIILNICLSFIIGDFYGNGTCLRGQGLVQGLVLCNFFCPILSVKDYIKLCTFLISIFSKRSILSHPNLKNESYI